MSKPKIFFLTSQSSCEYERFGWLGPAKMISALNDDFVSGVWMQIREKMILNVVLWLSKASPDVFMMHFWGHDILSVPERILIFKLTNFENCWLFWKAKNYIFVPFWRSSKENIIPGAIDVVVEVGGLIKDPDENTDFFQGRSTPNCPSQIVAVPKQPLGRAVDSSNLRFAYGKSKLNVCFSLFN